MSNNYALNSSNDIFLTNGRIQRVSEGAQVLQNVRCRLLTYLGEWFLNTQVGVPYFQEIFTKPANLARAESVIKRTILRTTGVEQIISFQLNFNRTTRRLSVEFEAATTFEDINSGEVFLDV